VLSSQKSKALSFFFHSIYQFSGFLIAGIIRLIEEYLERSGWQPQGRRKFLHGPEKLLRKYDASQMYDIFNFQKCLVLFSIMSGMTVLVASFNQFTPPSYTSSVQDCKRILFHWDKPLTNSYSVDMIFFVIQNLKFILLSTNVMIPIFCPNLIYSYSNSWSKACPNETGCILHLEAEHIIGCSAISQDVCTIHVRFYGLLCILTLSYTLQKPHLLNFPFYFPPR